MKLHRLTINNYRGIREMTVDFEGMSSVLFGYNGGGKSSVLGAINFGLSAVLNKITDSRERPMVGLNDLDIKLGSRRCELFYEVEAEGKRFTVQRTCDYNIRKRKMLPVIEFNGADDFFSHFQRVAQSGEPLNVPIYVNYGVNRSVSGAPPRMGRRQEFDIFSVYDRAVDSQLDFRSFFEWYRERKIYEKEVRDCGDENYSDAQLHCVKQAVLACLDGYTDLLITRNPLAMKAIKNGQPLYIEQLSDGEKCTLAMMGDLARRLALANPGRSNPLEGEGLVLIDEIELHLHPAWQRRIIPALRSAFPGLQFIVSTHSPQVLSEVDSSMKILLLQNDGESQEVSLTEMKPLSGWDVNDILELFMDTAEMNQNTKQLINEIYGAIEADDLKTAEEKLDRLEEMTSSKNKNVIELRFLCTKRKMRHETNCEEPTA